MQTLKNAGVQLCGSWIRVYDRQSNRDVAAFNLPSGIDDDTPDFVVDAKFDSWLIDVQAACQAKGYSVNTVDAAGPLNPPTGRRIIAIG